MCGAFSILRECRQQFSSFSLHFTDTSDNNNRSEGGMFIPRHQYGRQSSSIAKSLPISMPKMMTPFRANEDDLDEVRSCNGSVVPTEILIISCCFTPFSRWLKMRSTLRPASRPSPKASMARRCLAIYHAVKSKSSPPKYECEERKRKGRISSSHTFFFFDWLFL